ncbi:VOC family protein [Nocardia carnea]|uniref:VOC family protein n=1 Tax=Nocardia carnea TaxID=37328 RepID=UPI0024562014|nr:VOC family protein [Nocardia carnea]
MKYHHMCVVVKDMDKALTVYRDFLGLDVVIDSTVPDAPSAEDAKIVSGELLDKLFREKGATSHLVLLSSPEGLLMELQQPSVPNVESTPPEKLTYGFTGIREIAIAVTDIDTWFRKAREAGLETNTEEVWEFRGVMKSFLFYDHDGNLIQLVEELSSLVA